MPLITILSGLFFAVFSGNSLEGLLYQCPAVFKRFQYKPITSLLALSGTSHGIRDFVLTHTTYLQCEIPDGASERPSPFNTWSALKTLFLYNIPHSAVCYFAHLDLQYLRCLHVSSRLPEKAETGIAATLADGQLPALEKLYISHGMHSISDLEHLARGQWPYLKVLRINRYYTVMTKQQLELEMSSDPLAGSNWPLLECLRAFRWSCIHLCKVTGECKWPNLKIVEAQYVTGHPGAEYAHLKHIAVAETKFAECLCEVLEMHLPSLEHLHMQLHRAHGTLDMARLVNSGPWPHLTRLYIGSHQLGRHPFTPLQHTDWRQLKELDLTDNCLDVEAVRCLTACNWPCLLDLGLSANDLDRDAVQHLVCAEWPCLTSLYLCNVAVHLLIQENWPKLEHLYLSKNKIDSVALQTLLQGDWPELQELFLDGTDILCHDAIQVYSNAACIESCVFRRLMQEWCEVHVDDIASGLEPKYGATLGFP